MTLRSKKEYLQITRQRYISAHKTAKATILDEFCATCTYNRKYAIRLLNASKKKPCRKPRRPGPKILYKPKQLLQPLKRMWFATDQMCSKEAKSRYPLWLPFYEQEFGALTIAQRKARFHQCFHHRPTAQARSRQYARKAVAAPSPAPFSKTRYRSRTVLGLYAAGLLRGRHGCTLR